MSSPEISNRIVKIKSELDSLKATQGIKSSNIIRYEYFLSDKTFQVPYQGAIEQNLLVVHSEKIFPLVSFYLEVYENDVRKTNLRSTGCGIPYNATQDSILFYEFVDHQCLPSYKCSDEVEVRGVVIKFSNPHYRIFAIDASNYQSQNSVKLDFKNIRVRCSCPATVMLVQDVGGTGYTYE